MDAIFFVRRPGCHWKALHETDLCSSSSAPRRFQEWTAAGVFLALWQSSLVAYEALKGIDWEWLAMDGAMTKVPLGAKTVGKHPTDRGKIGTKRSLLPEGGGVPMGLAVDGANRHDFKMARESIASISIAPYPSIPFPLQGRSSLPAAISPQRFCG